MPIVNVYSDRKNLKRLKPFLLRIRESVARELTTESVALDYTHISLRLIVADGCRLGQIEFEIFAHCFPSRVQSQDDICIRLREQFDEYLNAPAITRVWLCLSEMGYGYLQRQASSGSKSV